MFHTQDVQNQSQRLLSLKTFQVTMRHWKNKFTSRIYETKITMRDAGMSRIMFYVCKIYAIKRLFK